VRLLLCNGIIFLQVLAVLQAEANSQYFDIPVWPGAEESCPAPGNIRYNGGVYRSPAKSDGVDWTGVLPNEGSATVVAFEKAVFVLTEKNSETRGFLSSCIYATSQGRYLNMRLDAGDKYDEVMWVVKSSSWNKSPSFSSQAILECTNKHERACVFFLK